MLILTYLYNVNIPAEDLRERHFGYLNLNSNGGNYKRREFPIRIFIVERSFDMVDKLLRNC